MSKSKEEESKEEFYITEGRIKRLHKIYKVKALAQELNKSDLSTEEKNRWFKLLNARLEEIRNMNSNKYKKEKVDRGKMTLYFTPEQISDLEVFQKKLKQETGQDYTLNQVVKLRATTQDFNTENLQIEQQKLQSQKQKEAIIIDAFTIFRNIGTNINQMTHRFNEEVKFFGRKHGITKKEAGELLDRVNELESTVMEFIQTNLKDI